MSNLTKAELNEIRAIINDRLAEFECDLPALTLGVTRVAYDVIDEWRATREQQTAASVVKLNGNGPIQHAYHAQRQQNGNGYNPAPESPDDDGVQTLADVWPPMPDLEGGVDHFAEYPVAGERSDKELQRVVERTLTTALKTAIDAPALSPQKSDEKLTRQEVEQTSEPTAPAPTRVTDNHAVVIDHNGLSVVEINQPRTLAEADGINDAVDEQPAPEADADDDTAVVLAALRMGKDEKAAALRNTLIELQIMSNDGVTMPTMEEWDKKRPKGMPKAQAILKRHDLTWNELAIRARLKMKRAGRDS